jgi:gliding motility-associated-like protein
MKKYIKYLFLVVTLSFITFNVYSQSIGGTTTGAATYCSTTNSGFVSLTGHVGNVQFWQLSIDGGLSWISIGNTNVNQTYFNLNQTTCYRAVVKNGAFPEDTSSIVCISVFPPSNAGTLSGGGIFCGASASGNLTLTGYAGTIVNWEYSIDGGATWIPIVNNTNTESLVGVSQTRIYRVVVQSGSCPTAISNTVTVTVYPQTVAGSVSGPINVCSGTNSGNLTLAGYTGTILGWVYSTNSGVSWTPVANTTNSIPYTNITQETWYKAIVRSGSCNTDSSSTGIIYVDPVSNGGVLSGGGTFCGASASGTLTLTGYVGAIVNWEYSINGGVSWTPIANTTNTESLSGVSQTRLYRVIVKSGSCANAISNVVTVTVNPQTVAGTISGPSTICGGVNSGNLTLTGNVGSVLGWIYSINNGVTWIPVSNTSNTLPFTNLSQTTWYKAIVQSGGCNIDSTSTHIITVDQAPNGGTLAGGGAFCGSTATGTLTLTGYVGNILNWEYSINGGTTWLSIANTSNTYNFNSLTQTTLYRVVVGNGVCTSINSNTVTVSVTPQTVAGTLLNDTTICPIIGNFSLTLTGNVGSVLFWQANNGSGWITITNTTTNQLVSGIAQNTQFRCVVQNGSCSIDTSNIVLVSVFNVQPVFAGNDLTINSGETVTLNGIGTGTPLWSPASYLTNPNSFAPLAKPDETTAFVLMVVDTNGCVNVDTVIVTVEQSDELLITNLFTPNGDGINDTWYIQNIERYPSNEVSVFNIYGKLIYSKKGYTNDWGGRVDSIPVTDGTYYYVIKLSESADILKGPLEILR